jgi:hypothetical protein
MCNRRPNLTRLILTLALLAALLSVAPIPTWAAVAPNAPSQRAVDGLGKPALVPEIQTTTTLTGPSGTFTTPQALTFTATVQEGATASQAKKSVTIPSPAGTVTFLDNGVNIPNCVNVALINHVATCTVTLGKGTHVITAVYSGDSFYMGSTSGNSLTLLFTFNDPAEVPEADTLVLFGGGASGVTLWLGWQWKKLKRRSK